jgi:DNA-directed RNA polymerase subunit M/transcription elongation factor TFIIS
MANFREAARAKILDLVEKPGVTAKIEKAMFDAVVETATARGIPPLLDASKDFRTMYTEKLRSILYTIKDPKNPKLLKSLASGKKKPSQLLELLPKQEMVDIRMRMKDELSEAVSVSDLVGDIERSLFNWVISTADAKEIPKYWQCKEFRMLYKEKMRSLLFNIKNPKNPRLLQSLLEGQTTPERLLEMTPQEMDPELWKPYYDKIEARDLLRSGNLVPEGILQCHRCKSKRVVWYQMQTRSADEPMTVFANCSECGKRWKS